MAMAIRMPRHLDRRDPKRLAEQLGLVYILADDPGYTRRRCGRGFSYLDVDAKVIKPPERDRLESLAVPPAWQEVWFCPHADGHVLATGVDGAERKQYRYHSQFREACERQKFERLVFFPRALRQIRRQVDQWLDAELGTRSFAIAAVLRLIDVGLLRIGNERSADNGHFGATTLQVDHLLSGSDDDGYMTLEYTAKSGKARTVTLEDETLVDVLDQLADDDRSRLFWFETDADPDAASGGSGDTGRANAGGRYLSAADVNRALAEIVGPAFTAKDFRLWGGTRAAFEARIEGDSLTRSLDEAAEVLGNTRRIARASYVHPRVLEADDDELQECWRRSRTSTWMSRADSALAKLLDQGP